MSNNDSPTQEKRPARLRSVVSRLRDDRGVALTEFALIAPLLMLLLFGMLDFGKAFNYWIDETHLANMGARWAVVNKNPGSGGGQTLQQYIVAQADTNELRNGGTTSIPTADKASAYICFPDGTGGVGHAVEVRVTATYHWLGFVSQKIGFLTTPIAGKAQMRIEQTPSAYAADGAC